MFGIMHVTAVVIEVRKGVRCHGTEVTGGCELLDMGATKFIWALLRALCPHNH